MAGLVDFGRFLRKHQVDRELRQRFGRLKSGRSVVYPMAAQLRLLIDANVAGEERVFGLEALSGDALFSHLAGGFIPSIDTVYRDFERFDAAAIEDLEAMMAAHGLRSGAMIPERVHLDIDTTVEPLFGSQQGALPGPNPRYHGRPSYHPLLAVLAETRTCVGARLRPGDRGFGEQDVPTIAAYVERLQKQLGSKTEITVRIDAAGDCTALFSALEKKSCRFITKLRSNAQLYATILNHQRWHVVDHDADGAPRVRVAVLDYQRDEWKKARLGLRVIAVRRSDRDSGKQQRLWDDSDDTIHVFITNDWTTDSFEVAQEYDGRAEIEPVIAELKNGWGIGKVPSKSFDANHAMLLLKLLTHNLLRAFTEKVAPRIAYWRAAWIRRALICRPGRLLRSGRRWTLRTVPTPPNTHRLE